MSDEWGTCQCQFCCLDFDDAYDGLVEKYGANYEGLSNEERFEKGVTITKKLQEKILDRPLEKVFKIIIDQKRE